MTVRIFMFMFEERSGLFFFKQKTAYEMRISDWSSDVCSSDLKRAFVRVIARGAVAVRIVVVRVRMIVARMFIGGIFMLAMHRVLDMLALFPARLAIEIGRAHV